MSVWFFIISVLMTASAFIAGSRWQFYRKTKQNNILKHTTDEQLHTLELAVNDLELASANKDILMKEIHHRIKNNLQMISTFLNLELSKMKDENAAITIRECIARISSIALIHKHLYNGRNNSKIEFSGFFNDLCGQVATVCAHQGINIDYQFSIAPTLLDVSKALPIGLILNELMTNSYKYAYTVQQKAIMKIDLSKDGNQYTLRYCDFGPGLPENYDVQTVRSLGMIIMKGLAKQIDGRFFYNKKDNYFTLNFMN